MNQQSIFPILKGVAAGVMLILTAAAGQAQEAAAARPETVRVAAAQIAMGPGVDSVGHMVEFVRRAAQEGCAMIVFPEYLLGAFEGEASPNVQRLAQAAREGHIYVVAGGWHEQEPGALAAGKQGAFSNRVLILDREGKIAGHFDKVHAAIGSPPHFWPPKGDEAEFLMKPGDRFPTFDLDFARVGVMTCYDGYFPESAASLSLSGAEIILWLNGRAGAVEDYLIRADTFRNYCAMIATNTGAGAGTSIATFPSNILARITEPGEHYITAEINLKALRTARINSRVFHQRRPELYDTLTTAHEPWKAYDTPAAPAPAPGQ